MRHTVIMAGGSGIRFWPQSRNLMPKQLLNLVGNSSMIQLTFSRISQLVEENNRWVVTNQQQAEQTQNQLSGLNPSNLIVEPFARNTTACIGLAALQLLKQDDDATMLVVPADHIIQDQESFCENIISGFNYVEKNSESIVLFGISPTYPSTGYGYIEKDGSGSENENGTEIYHVTSFHEKPEKEKAIQFLESDQFYWNSGIFIWRAKQILKLIKELEPEVGEGLQEIQDSWENVDKQTVLETEFKKMKSISIDHAVLEKSRDLCKMIPARFDWDDLGTWQSLARMLEKDEQGNCIDANHYGTETSGCLIRSTDPEHLIVTSGLDDCLIVHTPDATLIAKKNDEASIREIVTYLRENGYDKYL
jgi:mannose-1-phosphate guanylyltransferase